MNRFQIYIRRGVPQMGYGHTPLTPLTRPHRYSIRTFEPVIAPVVLNSATAVAGESGPVTVAGSSTSAGVLSIFVSSGLFCAGRPASEHLYLFAPFAAGALPDREASRSIADKGRPAGWDLLCKSPRSPVPVYNCVPVNATRRVLSRIGVGRWGCLS